MNECERIVAQLEAAIDGEPLWHGPNVRRILDGLDARAAAGKPIPGFRSVWELLLHLTGTQTLAFRRFAGDPTDLTPGEDFPPVPAITEANWNEAKRVFFEREQRIHEFIAQFPPAKLVSPLMPGGESAYIEFHTYYSHLVYHVSQMNLVKKALSTMRPVAARP